jgi:hypothetical protein
MCLITEIIRTCSHEKVAQAAVASMGPFFAGKVGSTAGAQGLSVGAFTARAVQEFEKVSGEEDWQTLRRAMDGADQPILIGLQHILWPVLEGEGSGLRLGSPRPANVGRSLQMGPASTARQDRRKTCCNSAC